jgi:hypothetical protein
MRLRGRTRLRTAASETESAGESKPHHPERRTEGADGGARHVKSATNRLPNAPEAVADAEDVALGNTIVSQLVYQALG